MEFEWDETKNRENAEKHGIDFYEAQNAFYDDDRLVIEDTSHSGDELRYFCVGDIGGRIATVRFTMREGRIRIFGAGYWRKGKKRYEERV